MKQLSVVLAAAMAVGCSAAPIAAPATLFGAHDLVMVDKLLFTTSTDRDELRVLDLVLPAGSTNRAFIRGPNPLEALSIPVLNRPSALSRDTHYEDVADSHGKNVPLGREVGGPWVYAMRAGGSEISIVGGGPAVDPMQLVEVKRVPTAAPVTASAGVALSKEASRLYFATFDGEAASLQALDLPGTVTALKPISVAALTRSVRVFAPFPGEVIVDLVVVPAVSGRGICELAGTSCVIFATRTMQGQGGRVVLFDPQSLALRELHFPGAIRQLAVHGATTSNNTFVPPGQRVFGILDEERCGGADCAGIIAVDTFTGEVALDASGLPMIPISTGNSLPTGLAVVAHGQLQLPPALIDPLAALSTPAIPVDVPAVGVITTSTGSFIFFDAIGLTPFDLDTEPTFASANNVHLFQPNGVLSTGDGGFPDSVPGPVLDGGPGITFANGAFHSETIDIVVNGLIPGLEDLPVDVPTSTEFAVPGVFANRIRVSDILVFKTPAGTCRGTVAEVTGNSVKAAPLDEVACQGRSRFGVRAGESSRYVVVGSLTGFMGRTGPDQTFNYRGSYYQRTPPFDPNVPTFSVVLGPEQPRLDENWRWSIDVQSADLPLILRIDSQTVGCSTNVAGSVVWDTDRQAIFSVLPAANAILEVNPQLARNGLLRDATGQCRR